MVQPEPQDRHFEEVSFNLTPEKISSIMAAANSGDIRDQVQLADEILEKNADVIQAFNTRRDAVMGLPWHIEHEDPSIAKRLEEVLRSCGDGDDADSFEDMLQDMLGAILPGFAVSEILWGPGGSLAGFRHIPQRNFTFVDSFSPMLITAANPMGEVLPRRRIVYHKRRFHGADPARGGLIRPLAWLHCFKHVGEKDLLSFVERHGMPFIAAKVDPTSFDKEKNMIKRLVRSFGSSGGGVFTKAVELDLLESHSTGDVYFRLLSYIEAAVNKVILGQTASSGDASGWSKGDAQSRVRQDILEADCRILQRLVDAQVLKPYMEFNYGSGVSSPHFVMDCAPPEDKEKIAAVVKTLHESGFETDIEQVSSLVGLKLQKRMIAPSQESAVLSGENGTPSPPAELTEWLGKIGPDYDWASLSDDDFGRSLTAFVDNVSFGNSDDFENTFAQKMHSAYEDGAKHGNQN